MIYIGAMYVIVRPQLANVFKAKQVTGNTIKNVLAENFKQRRKSERVSNSQGKCTEVKNRARSILQALDMRNTDVISV